MSFPDIPKGEIVKLSALAATDDDEFNVESVGSCLTYGEIFILHIEADFFFGTIHILHGPPRFSISDRNMVFTQFLHKFLQLMGTQLHHSSAYHQQLDGLPQKLNQGLEKDLCLLEMINPRQWLHLPEYWYGSKISLRICAVSKVLEKSGSITYKMNLPNSKFYQFLHVFLLRKCLRKHHIPAGDLFETDAEGCFSIAPLSSLNNRSIDRRVVEVFQVLGRWMHSNFELATWEDIKHIRSKFPSFDPWGQGSSPGGGNVMVQSVGKEDEDLGKKGKLGLLSNLGAKDEKIDCSSDEKREE